MKILAICGSPRKGNSYKALNEIRKSFPHVDYEILHLNDMNFNLSKGCYGCVVKGEEKCPLKDERDMILEKMMEADGVILASPVFSHMISALMKNFFERFAYLAHRPQFFDKFAMSMVTYSGYGAEDALKYMDKMLSVFGFNLAPSLELQIHPGKVSEDDKNKNREKAVIAVQKLDKDFMKADFEYYADKDDYYYDTNISFFKKFIAKKVSNKIISQFD